MPTALVIGGGPAGAAAATLLARAGRPVTLIERTPAPNHKVCGDFLSAEAIEAVAALGVDLASLAPSRINAVRLVHRAASAETRLPFPAFGVTRRALDEALLQNAAASGATVLRGRTARRISAEGASLRLHFEPGDTIRADAVFLASGKHDLRGTARPGRGSGPVGLKMYYRLDPFQQAALRNHVELFLFAGGYAGLQLVEAGQAVLCLLIARSALRRVGGQWDTLLGSLLPDCPGLAARLSGATALLHRPISIAGLPYGHLHMPNADEPPGLFRLGDQAAVIASLTGDGVALALASASLATATWLRRGDAAAYHRRLARSLGGQVRLASLVHRLCLAPAAQPWLVRAGSHWPAAIRQIATWTRAHDAGNWRSLHRPSG